MEASGSIPHEVLVHPAWAGGAAPHTSPSLVQESWLREEGSSGLALTGSFSMLGYSLEKIII